MIKTRQELEALLNTLNIQVFYNHTTQKVQVSTPYIVYIDTGTNNMFADNETYGEITSYSIIVLNNVRDEQVENSLKTLLTENNIPYDISDIRWNEDIMIWTTQFDITL
ncbi:MAG: hypothetical protein KBT03_11525 [Bacteroidales bacterium]|nr:hypothetical protein [Candidatus Scybalousia scybalohippi]